MSTAAKDNTQSGYLKDKQICTDLGWSPITLKRRRDAGIYPQPIKFVPGGRNNTPRELHEAYKAEAAASSPGVSEEKRELGRELARRRALARYTAAQEASHHPQRDPGGPARHRGKRHSASAPVSVTGDN